MSIPLSECNAGELITDPYFPNAPGAWNVGVQWNVPGTGFAIFNGISVVDSGIDQNIIIIKDHVLEIHLSVVGAFFAQAGKGLHIKIGGAVSSLISAVGSYVFYLLPTDFGSQLFEITSDTPNYDPPDFAIMSFISCQDTLCNIVKTDVFIPQPNKYYFAWDIGGNKLMTHISSRFDKTNILIVHDADFP